MGAGDKLKLTPYQSAAEAAQAVAKGETQFAVSHQSQILETYQQGGVTIPCAFDEKALEHGLSAVEGVGEKGYPTFATAASSWPCWYGRGHCELL